MSGSINDWAWWIHPRHAVEEASKLMGCSRNMAIVAIVRRLYAGKIVSVVGEYRGPQDDGNHLHPDIGMMPLWRGVWPYDIFQSPDSPVWTIGDVEGSLGTEPAFFFNVRLHRRDFEEMLQDCAVLPANDDRLVAVPPPSAPLLPAARQIQPKSKWPYEHAFAELVAIANRPDGLESINGFEGPLERSANAAISNWFLAFFSARHPKGEQPADSETRARAKMVLDAINR